MIEKNQLQRSFGKELLRTIGNSSELLMTIGNSSELLMAIGNSSELLMAIGNSCKKTFVLLKKSKNRRIRFAQKVFSADLVSIQVFMESFNLKRSLLAEIENLNNSL